jgi:hypothetical protein
MKRVKFESISPNEIKFEHQGHKFLLIEKDRGVYGMGRAVGLHKLDGLTKTYLKEIAWTRKDNHGGENNKDSVLSGIQTMDAIKVAAVKYVDSLLK